MARRPRRDARERGAGEVLRFLLSPGNAGGKIALLLVIVVVGVGYLYWKESPEPGSGPAGPTVSATNPGGQIRIATWNLRKFSEREGAGQHPPDLVTIARIIRDSGFDLVAIQEVQREGRVVERLRRQLNEPWRHAVSERAGNNERYAFLWRADRVEAVAPPRLYAGPEASSFSRVPVVAGFKSGQFDFTVVSVHLWYGDKANNPQRRTEADALARITREMAAH